MRSPVSVVGASTLPEPMRAHQTVRERSVRLVSVRYGERSPCTAQSTGTSPGAQGCSALPLRLRAR